VKRFVWIILGAVAVVAVGAFVLVQAAEEKVTKELVSRVDRISVPAGWNLEEDVVRGERFLCMDTNPCPSVYRRWNTGKQVTIADLQSVTSTTGFAMKTDGTCERRANVGGPSAVCSASGTDGDYDYQLNVMSPGKEADSLLVLLVEPHR
jgi:hypothetical protein